MGVLRGRTWTNGRQRGGSKPVEENPFFRFSRTTRWSWENHPMLESSARWWRTRMVDGTWRWRRAMVVVTVMGRGGTERNVTTPNCLIPGCAMRELIGNTDARGCGRAHG
ncbi:hypothetical protein PUN28_008479 [Cardiocondyla obscurior]|uniref:Uncharacterized protein n=1 Tax=Cardiocondyla obscurior TaxID=286306 RepID=A0AAW2FXY4_9HYME